MSLYDAKNKTIQNKLTKVKIISKNLSFMHPNRPVGGSLIVF